MVNCDTCGKDFSRKDALTRHRKYSCDASHKTEAKRNVDCVTKREESNSKPVVIPVETDDNLSKDIPTFDGAEFSGEELYTAAACPCRVLVPAVCPCHVMTSHGRRIQISCIYAELPRPCCVFLRCYDVTWKSSNHSITTIRDWCFSVC